MRFRLLDTLSIAALALLLTVGPLVANEALAAGYTSISDTVTRLKISSTADHTIVFTLPTGVNFDATGSTDVLLYDFPSGFSQGGTWATADFTFNDGTARTIDAVNAGAGVSTVSCTDGANNVGVAIDTTALAFRVIPCGSSYTASGNAATVTFTIAGTAGNGTLTNPSSAGSASTDLSMTDEGVAAANSGSYALGITDDDQVTTTATVSPSLTFDLDSGTTQGSDNNGPHTIALGTLSPSSIKTSDQSTINSLFVDLDTNASGGAAVTIVSANAGLKSVSANHTIAAVSGESTITAGSEKFGVCVESVAQTTGSLAAGTDYDHDGGTCNVGNTGTVRVGGVTASPSQLLNTASAAIAGGRAELLFKAAISATTPAANDYSDTMTLIATGTF